MNTKDSESEAQESEYCFPYHYVASYRDRRFAQHIVDAWGINYVSTIEYLLSRLDEIDSRRIVDIGCGDGRLSREIVGRFSDVEVTGVDYSGRAITLARAMNPGVPRLQFKEMDITESAQIGTYDTAILMEVFEHIPVDQAQGFMDGVRDMLQEGGTLLLTVPHQNKPLEYKHYQHFSISSLTSYLEDGFEVLEIVPFERISWMRGMINRILSNRLFVLNNPALLTKVYEFYERNLFHCSAENHCQRLFLRAVAK